jgi:hypothetical protein
VKHVSPSGLKLPPSTGRGVISSEGIADMILGNDGIGER